MKFRMPRSGLRRRRAVTGLRLSKRPAMQLVLTSPLSKASAIHLTWSVTLALPVVPGFESGGRNPRIKRGRNHTYPPASCSLCSSHPLRVWWPWPLPAAPMAAAAVAPLPWERRYLIPKCRSPPLLFAPPPNTHATLSTSLPIICLLASPWSHWLCLSCRRLLLRHARFATFSSTIPPHSSITFFPSTSPV